MNKLLLISCFISIGGIINLQAQAIPPQFANHPSSYPGDNYPMARLYPNPAIEEIHIKFQHPITHSTSFSLHNIIGNQISIDTSKQDDFTAKINVSHLSAGIYMLSIAYERTKEKTILKFIKK